MSKFANACIMSYNDWVATIPAPEDLPEPDYSKRHIKRINALKNKMRGNVYHHFTTRAIKIMLVAAVLFALLLTAFVIPSSREFIIDNLGIYSTYQLTEENLNSVNGEIEIGYIPEGFELIDENVSVKLIINTYMSTNGQVFSIHKYSSSIEVDFDTELGKSETIIINDIAFTVFTDENSFSNIIWTEYDHIYKVEGNLTKDELLKIAESVK